VASNSCGAGSTASRTLKPKSCSGSTFTRNYPSEETILDLIVWPIPANQEIHLETIGFKADQLEIVGSQGQMVMKSNWKSTLKVGHLPSGTYFIKATGKGGTKTHKIQIIH
jgi:hypothetical protein